MGMLSCRQALISFGAATRPAVCGCGDVAAGDPCFTSDRREGRGRARQSRTGVGSDG
jgi:hypothetical protein